MTDRINWDDVSRKQRAQQHGIEYGFDELPPIGTYADQKRVDNNKQPASKRNRAKHNGKRTVSKAAQIAHLKENLMRLAEIPDTTDWIQNGPGYQRKILKKTQNTFIALLHIEPSAINDPCFLKIKHFLRTTRITELKEKLTRLAEIPDLTNWTQKSSEYQFNILEEIQSAFKALLNIEPSAVNDPCLSKIKRLLSRNSSCNNSPSEYKRLNKKEIAMLNRIKRGNKLINSKPIGIYGSNYPKLRGYKK